MIHCPLRKARVLIAALLLLVAMPLPASARCWRRNSQPATAPTSPPLARRSMQLTYPATRRGEQSDDYHGTQVADPYRWLEELDSPETRAWALAQNQVTHAWLG